MSGQAINHRKDYDLSSENDDESSGNEDDDNESKSSITNYDDDNEEDESHNHKKKKKKKKRKRKFPKPRIVDAIVDFSLGPVNQHLTCRLCEGYFRDPISITECLHTFCKSCLYYAFSAGFRKCPTCDVALGCDPFKSTLPDRTLEQLVDKVLFTDLHAKDEELEKKFYAEKGIALKPEYAAKEQQQTDTNSNKRRRRKYNTSDSSSLDNYFSENSKSNNNKNDLSSNNIEEEKVEFLMIPGEIEAVPIGEYAILREKMPPMKLDLLCTSSKIKIFNLKRFLISQLNLENINNLQQVDIMCNGTIVGNELSLTFIKRTVWMNENDTLILSYAYADEHIY